MDVPSKCTIVRSSRIGRLTAQCSGNDRSVGIRAKQTQNQ